MNWIIVLLGIAVETFGLYMACGWDLNGHTPLNELTFNQVVGMGWMAMGFIIMVIGIVRRR